MLECCISHVGMLYNTSGISVTWLHNGNVVIRLTTQFQLGNTLMLYVRNFELSAAGVYQCVLNDTVIGCTLRRTITLFIRGVFVQYTTVN